MKKLVCMLLAILMAVSMIAVASADSAPKKISLISRYAETDNITYVLKTLTDEYNALNPDKQVELELNIVPATDEVILVNAASGDIPDIMLCAFVPTIRTLASMDMICDMEELFAQAGVTDCVSDTLFAEVAAQQNTEKCWSMPSCLAIEGFWYHMDLFKQAGIEAAPTTMEEFEEDCDKLLAAGILPWAFCGCDYPVDRQIQALSERLGGPEFAIGMDNGNQNWSNETVYKAMNKLLEWNKKGYWGPGITTVDKNTMISMFNERQAAMTYYSTNGSSLFSKYENNFGEVGFFPYPTWESEGGVGKITDYPATYGWIWCVSKAAVDEAFLDWFGYVMPRYGDTALNDIQLITPFKYNEESAENVGWFAKVHLEELEKVGDTFNVLCINMPSEVYNDLRANEQLMLLGEMTPEEVCKTVDDGFIMYE